MAPPFKAEHLGSLLRPQKLLDVREAIREKGVAPEDAGLDAAEKEAVSAVIQMQRDLGLKAVTDGEYTRTRFWGCEYNPGNLYVLRACGPRMLHYRTMHAR